MIELSKNHQGDAGEHVPRHEICGSRGFRSMVGWPLAGKATGLGFSFIVGVLVARHLGAEAFGTLNHSLAFAGLFTFVASLGLDTTLKRDLVAEPGRRSEILATAAFLRSLAAAVALFALSATAFAAFEDPRDQAITIMAGLYVVGSPIRVLDLDLQARLHGLASATANFVGMAAAALWRLLLISGDAPLAAFAAASAIEAVAVGVVLLIVFRGEGTGITWSSVKFDLARRLLRDSWPLIISGAAVSIYLRIDQVMLSVWCGVQETGVYSAAVRLSELGNPIAVILAAALLPGIVKAEQNRQLHATARRAFESAAAVAFALAVLGTLTAPVLIPLCFGIDYRPSIPIFMVLVWSNLFVFLGVVRTQVLAAQNATKFLMCAALAGAATNVLLNWWWIPLAGAVGAAWATLVAYAVAAWISTLAWSTVRDVGRWQTQALLSPWRALQRSPE